MNETVNRVVNTVIKERPACPLSAIASYLLQSSGKSYPTFDKMTARRIFIGDNLQLETVKISVHLNYQGRSAMRYRHTFAYDPEEHDRMLFDDQAGKTGLTQACSMIGEAITETLRQNLGDMPLDLDAFRKLDGVLLKFYEQNLATTATSSEAAREEVKSRPGTAASIDTTQQSSPGKAFIKACSEAVFFGVAHCIK